MAVELCTESPTLGMSPRISFSHDLNQSGITPIEPHIPLKSSLIDLDFDFDFGNTRRSYDQESSLADELFENGIILPIQIKRKNIPIKSKSLSSISSTSSTSSSGLLLPSSSASVSEPETAKETEEKHGSSSSKSSFWGFKRSKSLNCGSIYRRGLCSLPLLSRSKSTGSNASSKRSLIPKDESKQSTQKNSNSNSGHHKKPPLKKNYGSSFNSGVVHVSPVLNVPSVKLLGFGSFFSNGKDKGKKK